MAAIEGTRPSPLKHLEEAWEEDDKIVVGIDIGTTQSAVALAYLERGKKLKINRISKWPGQGEHDQRAKIPTVIWYEREIKEDGSIRYNPKSFGAEAMSHEGQDAAADGGWLFVRHFKLHLQPKELRKADMRLDALPPGITLAQIYSDFLGYLLKHTKAFVEKRIPLGKRIWEKHKPEMEVVIAHPNGWDTFEQSFLRQAVIDSGFVDAGKAARQVQFVTEAEASVHYCIHYSDLASRLETGTNLIVCDAGGSTVDTTLYSVFSAAPSLQLGEARLSDSVQAGGILVNMKLDTFIRKALNDLELPMEQSNEFAVAGIEDFENYAKRDFGNSEESLIDPKPISIRVGLTSSGSYGSTAIKIHRGRMQIPRSIIKECFDASTIPILLSVGEQLRNHNVQYILLVGGFGDSPYIHSRFETQFESESCHVVLANESTSKAVAEGSVIWNSFCSVFSRTPRRSFGLICAKACLPWMPEAEGRDMYLGPQGIPVIPGRWVQIAKKGVPVDAEKIYRDTVHHSTTEKNPTSLSLSMDLFSYSGDDEPKWAKDNEGRLGNLLPKFKKICTLTATVINLEGALKKQTGLLDVEYWDLVVDMCICFGTTELKAYLEWEQNGVKLTGTVVVIPGRPVDL